MSWQGYVDQSLISTGKFDGAAIFSAAGDSVWAASSSFAAKPEELKALVKGFNHPPTSKDPNPLFASGFTISGVKYMTIKADDRSIYGRKDKEGVCCVKTKQAIIIAHYPPTTQSGEAAIIVEKLGDYLIGVGY